MAGLSMDGHKINVGFLQIWSQLIVTTPVLVVQNYIAIPFWLVLSKMMLETGPSPVAVLADIEILTN